MRCSLALSLALPMMLTALPLAPAAARPQARGDNNGSGSGNDRGQQKSFALIFGTVWDPDGHPLYGVKVKIRAASENKARWELYSNHTGEFAQRMPVGNADYIVWADLKGYKLASGRKLKPGPEVTVHIENDERSDIGLHLDWQ